LSRTGDSKNYSGSTALIRLCKAPSLHSDSWVLPSTRNDRRPKRNTLIGLRKAFLARHLQDARADFTNDMKKYVQPVHPAISAVLLALLALTVVGTLAATGLLS
jgi:hypothetical protein